MTRSRVSLVSRIPPRLRRWLVAVALALVALVLVIRAWPGKPPAPAADAPLQVGTATAAPATLARPLRLSGILVACEDIAIGTALQEQRVAEVHAEVGDVVRRGQLLARLEADGVQAQLRQAEAALARARAAMRQQQVLDAEARASLQRIEPLGRSGSVSAQQVDEQRARAAAASASLQAARAEMEQAQVADSRSQRGKADILAPADGVIAARTARVGALAGAEPLFRLIQDGAIEFDGEASAAELALLAPGMPVRVAVDGLPADLDGEVRLLTPEVDARTRLGRVRIALRRAEGLRAGGYAEARLALPPLVLALALPARAVAAAADGEASVMRVDAAGQVTRRVVVPGRRGGGVLEILGGLQPGERVVLDAAAFVHEGDVVAAAAASGAAEGRTP